MDDYIKSMRKRERTESKRITIIPINGQFRAQVDELIKEGWSGPHIVTKGVLHDTREHSGFVAVSDSTLAGYVLFRIADNECEIIVLESLIEKHGIGSALINAVIQEAKKTGCCRLWLITTNDNTHAIRFYQRFGFSLRDVLINAMERARELKPSIPLTGNDDIPLLHEFEFEMRL